MKKRLITLLTVFSMLFSMTTPITYAKSDGFDINEKRKILESFGILNSSMFMKNYVEFEDFILAVSKALGNEKVSEENVKSFAINNKIIAENTDVDADLTMDAAAAVMVKSLGYRNIALYEEISYLQQAIQLGLLKGIKNNEDIVSGDTATLMLYNLINSDVIIYNLDGHYNTSSGSTVMNKLLKIHKADGVVSAVKGETLYGKEANFKNEIIINSVRYTTKLTKLSEYFAKYVSYYYRITDDDEKEILYISTDPENELNLSPEEIDLINYNNSKLTVKYIIGNRSKTITSMPAFFVKNGVVISDDTDINALVKTENAHFTFVDHDSDNQYDVVFVWVGVNYFADKVAENFISDKYSNPSIKIENENNEYTYAIYDGDVEITSKDLKDNSVITIYRSDDGYFTKMLVSNEIVSGNIKSKYTNEKGQTVVCINDEEYVTLLPKDKFKVGSTTSVYLDFFGRIGGISTSAVTKDEYAWLVRAYKSDDEEQIVFKVVTQDSGMIKLKSEEETVRVTKGGKTEKYVFETLPEVMGEDATGNIKSQLIKYYANGDVIKKIEIAEKYTRGSENIFNYYKSAKNQAYGGGRICGVMIQKNTWVLGVPPEDNKNEYRKYENGLTLVDKKTYDIELYDLTENMECNVLIVNLPGDASGTVSSSDVPHNYGFDPAVVKKVKKVEYYDEEEDSIVNKWEVTCHKAGSAEEQTLEVFDSEKGLCLGSLMISGGDFYRADQESITLIDTRKGDFLVPGDVIMICAKDGILYGAMLYYHSRTDTFVGQSCDNTKYTTELIKQYIPSQYEIPSGYNISTMSQDFSNTTALYGVVESLSDTTIVFKVENDKLTGKAAAQSGYLAFPLKSSQNGVLYGKNSRITESISITEVRPGDEIIYIWNDYSFRGFIVFRDEVE